jgi:hypothetical protein
MNKAQELITVAAKLTKDEAVITTLRLAYTSATTTEHMNTLNYITNAGTLARGEKCKEALRLAYTVVVNSAKTVAPSITTPRIKTSRAKPEWKPQNPKLVAAKAEAMATGKTVVVNPAFPKKAAA